MPTASAAPQSPLEQLAARYFQLTFAQYPLYATALGIHDYDDRLGDLSAAAIGRYAEEVGKLREELAAFDPTALAVIARSDYQLLAANMEDTLLDIAQLREWENAPQSYVDYAVYAVFLLLAREFAPLDERMRSVVARLQQIPALLAQGRAQVQNPPPIFTETAIEATAGAIGFIQQAVPPLADALADADLKQAVRDATVEATSAMNDYLVWLRDDLSPRSNGEFALGRDHFWRKLQLHHMLEQTPEEIAAWGRALFADTLAQLREVAAEIDPDKDWSAIIAECRADHPTADHLLDAYREESDRLVEFITRHQLVTIPAGELQIVETPPFQRATYAFAGYAQPGPFDAVQSGQFWVTPVDPHAPAAQQERQLEEHAWAWIPVIALHEGYPGHHLQLLWANQHSTFIRKHLGNSSLLVEGWGLYCEQMIGEVGYFDDPRVKLNQLRGQLWRAARVIIDVGLHLGSMSVDEAVSFLADEVKFSPAAARGEVRRYTMTPGQPMSYLLGKDLILKLRDEARARWGDAFTLQRFHDRLLASGSIPLKLVREEFWAGEGDGV